MSRSSFLRTAVLLGSVGLAMPALASSDARHPYTPSTGWPHHGLTGTFDRAALQRGYQVYKQVCSSCHSLNQLAYRNLTAIGLTEAEVKAIAAEYQVPDAPNDQGEVLMRPARLSDRFVAPFANEQAARAANNGALPPDLSLIVKARKGHEDYIYSLLTGYMAAPAEEKVAEGMNYNPYFPGHQIAMPPPLSEGGVTYTDGTKATVSQMASDVTQFLAWASEPSLEERKRTGVKVILFLAVFAGIMYGVKRRIWAGLH